MRQTFQVMGTVASLDIPDCYDRLVFESAFERLRQIDDDYSPFKTTSLLSRFNKGRLKKANREFQDVLKACQDWQKITNGYFSAWYKGEYEPSGYVKGWAIAEAGKLIEKSGFSAYCLGIGGDVLAKGKPWRIGITDPRDPKKIGARLEVENQAVATSGNYERGHHIYIPKAGEPADFWQSVTIINKDIIKADVWATAAFAMQEQATAKLAQADLDFLLIDKSGCLVMSDGAKALAGYS